ncbi:MAG: hypothetical protein QF757_05165, partial [Candidatus Marinimicrobia bacterium]|nr:hypothetical protein [Candidatus Neomarinimicrobiota bacterium]
PNHQVLTQILTQQMDQFSGGRPYGFGGGFYWRLTRSTLSCSCNPPLKQRRLLASTTMACPPKTDPFAVLGFGSKPDD